MVYITDQCLSCGGCASTCPTHTIYMGDSHYQVGPDCVECGACVDQCPAGAIVKD